MTILLVNGPNLNLLGQREPEKYGTLSLACIVEKIRLLAQSQNYGFLDFQSNHEGELIDFIQQKGKKAKGMILNPGALTHTSIALRDAILAVALPFIEVHLTNIYQREPFRHHSYFKDISLGQIVGLGVLGYELAFSALTQILGENKN